MLNNFCTDYGMGKDIQAIQKRIRIQLFNIGTNPMKRGVIFFQTDQEGFQSKPTLKFKTFVELEGNRSSIARQDQAVDFSLLNKLGKDRCTLRIFKPSNSTLATYSSVNVED